MVHITCTRSLLSSHPIAELKRIEGVYDPRAAVALFGSLRDSYAESKLAPTVVRCSSTFTFAMPDLSLDSLPSKGRPMLYSWTFHL